MKQRVFLAVALAAMLAGCATFPDNGPRDWKEKLENAGELGGPPVVLKLLQGTQGVGVILAETRAVPAADQCIRQRCLTPTRQTEAASAIAANSHRPSA